MRPVTGRRRSGRALALAPLLCLFVRLLLRPLTVRLLICLLPQLQTPCLLICPPGLLFQPPLLLLVAPMPHGLIPLPPPLLLLLSAAPTSLFLVSQALHTLRILLLPSPPSPFLVLLPPPPLLIFFRKSPP